MSGGEQSDGLGPRSSEEPMFCSQQIKVPESFPEILKQYTKAAIRTQPRDLLAWSAAYFRALANGEKPPVKERLEYPPLRNSASGLTPGLLKVLHNQLNQMAQVEDEDLAQRWSTLGLNRQELDALLQAGGLQHNFQWRQFAALAAASMAKDLNEAMVILCELMTTDPPGGPAAIPFTLFREMYIFLSFIDKDADRDRTEQVITYLSGVAAKNNCKVTPTDLDSPDCPRLS